jgi:hypothetical protein
MTRANISFAGIKQVIGLAALSGLVFLGPSSFAQASTPVSSITNATWTEYSELYERSALCGNDEITLWSCEIGERKYSLCSSHVVTRSTGYMQYRASDHGRITFVYPATKEPPDGYFTYSSAANGDASIDFVSRGFKYSLMDSLRGNSSILVSRQSESSATTEMSCGGGMQTLQLNYNPTSNIQIRSRQRISLDELAPGLDLIPHQRREDLVRTERVLDLHLHEPS